MHRAKLSFVDLAGSERMDRLSSKEGQTDEARYIDRSLTALGKCIIALAIGASAQATSSQDEFETSVPPRIPYRLEKEREGGKTRILKLFVDSSLLPFTLFLRALPFKSNQTNRKKMFMFSCSWQGLQAHTATERLADRQLYSGCACNHLF